MQMRLKLCGVTGLLTILLLVGLPAYADDIHLCATNVQCSASSVQPIPSSQTTAFVFGAKPVGELFLAELVPVAGASGNFNSSTDFWTAVGESQSLSQPKLSPTQSQEAMGLGLSSFTGTFNVSDFDKGAWTTNGQAITLPASTAGTIFLAFNEVDGVVTLVSPFSSDLISTGTTTTAVPEPSTGLLSLLGAISLAGLAFLCKL
jgi:hypothetical protein